MGSQKFRHDWATCTFQEDELEKEVFLTNLQANSFQPVLPHLGTDDGTKMALVQASAGLCWVKPLGSPRLDSSVWDTVFPATVMASILASAGKASPCSLVPSCSLGTTRAQSCASAPVSPKLPGFFQNNLCKVLEQPTAHVSLASSSLTVSLLKERTLETFLFSTQAQCLHLYC